MAKTKPQDRSKKSKKNGKKSQANGTPKKPKASPETLLAQAIEFLQTSQPEDALVSARRALALLQPSSDPTIAALPAISLLGEINVELGDAEAAREFFTTAALLDPNGEIPEEAGGGAEKFLWLAQLCEEGGAESVGWFEKGATIVRVQIAALESKRQNEETQLILEEKRGKLANALCGMVEVYMTDLSWEEDAETRCETLITEALLVAPDSPESLQTLASVRISQLKREDARSALSRSLGLWKDLHPEDPRVPDFPTRISLSRLLMEAEMEEDAIDVLTRLIAEDDSSVEAWYLGGWCQNLMAEKHKSASTPDQDVILALQKDGRKWLQNSLRLYQLLEYEDGRLRDHAVELVTELHKILGPPPEDGEEDEDDDWEDEGSEDEEMDGT